MSGRSGKIHRGGRRVAPVRGATSRTSSTARKTGSARGPQRKGDKIRVLVVEDDADFRDFAETVLSTSKEASFLTLSADTLRAGLRMLKQHPVDVVMLDLNLPDSKGMATIDSLKTLAETHPVVISSALKEDSLIFEAMEKGAQDYLIKGPATGLLLAKSLLYAMETYRARKELTANEQQLRMLFDNSPDAIFIQAADGNIIDVNRAACSLCEMNRNTLLHARFPDMVCEEHRKDMQTRLSRWTGKERLLCESTLLTASGAEVPVEIRGARLPSYDQRSFLLHAHDITNRKRAEDALRKSEERYRSIFETAANMVAVVNNEGDIVECNKQAQRLLGYRPHELIGSNIAGIVDENDVGVILNVLKKLPEDGTSYLDELQMQRKDSTMVEVQISLSAMRNPKDEHVQTICIIEDISQRKAAEKRALETQQQLRNLAGRLREMREEERKRMAHRIHDDLGQALTALKMDLTWIKRHASLEECTAERLQEMDALIDQTVQTVRGLSMQLRPGLLDHLGLQAAMEWEAEEFRKRTDTKIVLTLQENAELDQDRATTIFRIFQELLTNIARHSHASEAIVSLKFPDNLAVLEVRDNGVGINIAPLSPTRSLGLIEVRESCIEWGGAADIQTTPGGGTTVTVSIPISRDKNPEHSDGVPTEKDRKR